MRCAIFLSALLLVSASGHPIDHNIWLLSTEKELGLIAVCFAVWDILA